jgi:hypothetical protein
MKTFAERFCAFYGVEPCEYTRAVFHLTAYRRARFLAPILRLFNPDYFACDYNFIRGVGEIERDDELIGEIRYFYWHPWNRGFLRRTLRLRVSAARMTALTRSIMRDGDGDPISWERSAAARNNVRRPVP